MLEVIDAAQAIQKKFKLEAWRLAASGDGPETKVARELEFRVNQLRNWKARLELEAVIGAPAKSQPSRR